MRIEQLYYILEVDKQGSISQAAKKLYISQPSLSASIGNFEKEFNTKIFYRSQNGVKLTDKGQLIVEQLKVIVNEIDNLRAMCAEEPGVLKGNISVSTLPALGNYILLNVFTIFKQKHPQVNMSIKEDDNSNIMEDLETGEIDVGLIGLFQHEITGFQKLLSQKELYYQELFIDELCLYASKNNPLLDKESIYLRETRDYPLIIYKNNVLDRDFAELNLNHSNILRFNDRESMKQMVSNGNALAIFPRITSVNDLYVASGNIVPLNIIDFKIPLYIGIIFNERDYLSNIQYEFIRVLEEQLASIEY